MSLTLERIEGLAPDQASLAAARKLLKPSSWPTLAQGDGLIWGECQGSGATPYRVVVSEANAGYKCTCPMQTHAHPHVDAGRSFSVLCFGHRSRLGERLACAQARKFDAGTKGRGQRRAQTSTLHPSRRNARSDGGRRSKGG